MSNNESPSVAEEGDMSSQTLDLRQFAATPEAGLFMTPALQNTINMAGPSTGPKRPLRGTLEEAGFEPARKRLRRDQNVQVEVKAEPGQEPRVNDGTRTVTGVVQLVVDDEDEDEDEDAIVIVADEISLARTHIKASGDKLPRVVRQKHTRAFRKAQAMLSNRTDKKGMHLCQRLGGVADRISRLPTLEKILQIQKAQGKDLLLETQASIGWQREVYENIFENMLVDSGHDDIFERRILDPQTTREGQIEQAITFCGNLVKDLDELKGRNPVLFNRRIEPVAAAPRP